MRIKVSNRVFLDFFILICMLVFSFSIKGNDWPVKNNTVIITTISFFLIALSLFQMHSINIPILSFTGVFLILLHIFCLGNYYIKAFGKEEYYLFGDWFRTDIDLKVSTGLFALCVIEAIFIGMLFYIEHEKDSLNNDFRFFKRFNDGQKKNIIIITGYILLAITLPCRLYADYKNILTSSINGEYAGFTGFVGVVDDIQTLFIPALICFLYGKRENKRLCRTIIIIYLFLCIIVMAASGSRRYYITAIIAVFLFYYNTKGSAKRKSNPFTIICIGVSSVLILNLMTMIRSYRHTALGIGYLLKNHADDLFSLDFLWESFTEFGLTGNVIYYAQKHFPSQVRFQLGYTYIASLIYILPIGWFVSLRASIGSVLYSITGAAVGGSIVADLYGNWGWFSVVPALVLGYIIAKICYTNNMANKASIKGVVCYAAGYEMLNYVRASTSEIVRYTAYTIIAIYFISQLVSSRVNVK